MTRLFDYLVVENFFSEEELTLIWRDIDHAHQHNWFSADNIATAKANNSEYIASKTGFFLHQFTDTEATNTYKACSKIFDGHTYEFSKFFSGAPVLYTTRNSVLISNYVNGGYYKKHKDKCITSVLFWLARDETKFTGGDLYFPELDEKINFGHNKMIMFPSQAIHEVTEVLMSPNESVEFGRYCITMFLF